MPPSGGYFLNSWQPNKTSTRGPRLSTPVGFSFRVTTFIAICLFSQYWFASTTAAALNSAIVTDAPSPCRVTVYRPSRVGATAVVGLAQPIKTKAAIDASVLIQIGVCLLEPGLFKMPLSCERQLLLHIRMRLTLSFVLLWKYRLDLL